MAAFLRRALLALCAALPCPPAAEAGGHLSQAPAVAHARALIHDGEYHAALVVLRPLVADPGRADITDIRFLIGIAAITAAAHIDTTDKQNADAKDALLRESIAALRAILIDRPELTRVRLELARAFFMRGDDALSRRHFERVLAGRPPPAMAANIQKFLRAIRDRRAWSGYLSLGVEQNDNINSGADADTIYIFGLPFVIGESSRRQSGAGLSVSGGVDYQRRLSERWRWGFGMDAARSEYDGHEFDQTYLRWRGGPRWLASARTDVNLQGFAGRRWLARDRHSVDTGARLTARHRFTGRFSADAQAVWEKTRLRRARGLDAIETEYGIGGAYRFSPLVQGRIGVDFSRTRRDDRLRIVERRADIGVEVILRRGWSIGGHLEVARMRHNRNAPLSSHRRADRRRIARVFLLNRQLTLFGFSPQLIASRERQTSNSELHNYRRSRVDLRFVRQF